MALLQTPLKDSSFYAPDFNLKNVDGKDIAFKDAKGKNGTLVMFICNHCPYVLAVIERLTGYCKELQEAGIGVIAVMPNDTNKYPDDSFENMKLFAQKYAFTFPYVIDETQSTAKAYGAVCTPDLFGFNAEGRLEYRGRVDSAANKPADANTVLELKNAMLQIAKTGAGPSEQFPSMGCSIKWR